MNMIDSPPEYINGSMGYLEDGIEPRTRLMICRVWESFFCQVQHGNGVVCVICAGEE